MVFSDFSLSALLLIAAMLCGRIIPIPLAYHPLSFFALFCQALAAKVHLNLSRTTMQQHTSGVMALLLAVGLPMILLACTYLLASWSLLIDAIVLLCCSNWQLYQAQAQRIGQNLDKSLLSLARTQARLLLLRDTKPLSQLGLIKAIIESLTLRFSQHIIAMVFWYLIAGAMGLLCYRLCQIASQQWSVKLTTYQYFGQAACRLHALLCAIPYSLSALLYRLQSLKTHTAAPLPAPSEGQPLPLTKLWLLQHVSRTLHVSLVGPLYYQQQLVRRIRLQQTNEPNLADLNRLLRLQQHQFTLILLLLSALVAVSLFSQ
ncbi:cobalamin biosynthesis protein CobD/CbiB [Alishewanella tabrizica]|uniref:Cobalamin biosynthesis protein CbiB n=1 Tax=Alishewanella tabrizica TaxID=671278 RepID=A0ABQ2WFP0_9ALTE|nr:cobalamin biosynthesis protein [Alishewanella tabrizica]GGW53873.1 hypothetical protein GCM10008111_07610 [Alishewanella tabrizica]